MHGVLTKGMLRRPGAGQDTSTTGQRATCLARQLLSLDCEITTLDEQISNASAATIMRTLSKTSERVRIEDDEKRSHNR
ncbi:hypothetical protein H351_31180 (plasmid) [Rhodococcus erythropolis R138]|nr:hypothetical protein H351_31180 [Rhodococcus erythropolis R138]